MDKVIIECVDCKTRITLPETSPGTISIQPLKDWTAPPPRCPICSIFKE